MAAKNATSTPKSPRAKAGQSASSSNQATTGRGKKTAVSHEDAADKEVALDRRRGNRRDTTKDSAPAPKLERRTKVQRRRQIDPTTCERDYSDDEVGFMNALDEYKRKSGRMFPTCSEVLEVIRGLGYVKLTPVELAQLRPEGAAEVVTSDATCEADELEPVC